jgi:predicted ester cyclase
VEPIDIVNAELDTVGRCDPAALAAHFAEHTELVDLAEGTVVSGRAALLEDLVTLFTAIPDLHVSHRRVVAQGRVVAAEIDLAGTPVGEFRRHAPTGRPITWVTCSFYDIDETGLIQRERMYYDAAALDRQLSAGLRIVVQP